MHDQFDLVGLDRGKSLQRLIELARILALELFDSRNALIRFDMSEFSERDRSRRGTAP